MLSKTDIIARSVALHSPNSGIYFLISETDEVIYVGQSIDVEARIGQRRRKVPFAKWTWVPCPRGELNILERAYITALQPSLNADPETLTARGMRKPEKHRRGWGRGVQTPEGSFVSLAAAARHHGVSRQAIWERAERGKNGWTFLTPKAVFKP